MDKIVRLFLRKGYISLDFNVSDLYWFPDVSIFDENGSKVIVIKACTDESKLFFNHLKKMRLNAVSFVQDEEICRVKYGQEVFFLFNHLNEMTIKKSKEDTDCIVVIDQENATDIRQSLITDINPPYQFLVK